MKALVILATIFSFSFAVADVNATGGGLREANGTRAAAMGESLDKCLAQWSHQHLNEKELNISLDSTDPSLQFLQKCTANPVLISKDLEQNRAIAERLVATWSKTQIADAGIIRIVPVTGGDAGESIPVRRMGIPGVRILIGGSSFRVLRGANDN
jgi:hypothetical protein